MEYLIAFFGIKYTFAFSAFIYLLGSFLFSQGLGVIFLSAGALFIGLHDQCTMMATIKAITILIRGPLGIKYVAYAMVGYAVSPFIWPMII